MPTAVIDPRSINQPGSYQGGGQQVRLSGPLYSCAGVLLLMASRPTTTHPSLRLKLVTVLFCSRDSRSCGLTMSNRPSSYITRISIVTSSLSFTSNMFKLWYLRQSCNHDNSYSLPRFLEHASVCRNVHEQGDAHSNSLYIYSKSKNKANRLSLYNQVFTI